MTSTLLRVGDRVLWSGAWGLDAPRPARVTGIELVEPEQVKGGVPVDAVPWSAAVERDVIVDLDNGHWAYGHQLRPLPPEPPEADCVLDSRGTCVFHGVVHEYVNDADETGAAPHM